MKKLRAIFPFMLALVLMFSIGVTAFADEPAAMDIPANPVQSLEEDAAADPIPGVITEEELPAVVDITPADPVDEAVAEPAAAVEQPQPAKSSNTPYLVGAVLAVALFIGVAVFCKFKGNR